MKKIALLSSCAAVLAAALAAAVSLSACSGEECLQYNENCSRDYKIAEYGTEDIDCCEGTCQAGTISGVLICRN